MSPLLQLITALDKSAEMSPRYAALVLFHPRRRAGRGRGVVVRGGGPRAQVADRVDAARLRRRGRRPALRRGAVAERGGGRDGRPTTAHGRMRAARVGARREDGRRGALPSAHGRLQTRDGPLDCGRRHPSPARRRVPDLPASRRDRTRQIGGAGARQSQRGALPGHRQRRRAPALLRASRAFWNGALVSRTRPSAAHRRRRWDPTVAGGQPARLSLIENVIKEAREEAGVPAEWIAGNGARDAATLFADHTDDPVTITGAKSDGTCLKNSLYYSCDLRVPRDWTPTPVDGEVSEFRLYTMGELEEELRCGDRLRPAMRAVLLDFMLRHGALKGGGEDEAELRQALRRERLILWP